MPEYSASRKLLKTIHRYITGGRGSRQVQDLTTQPYLHLQVAPASCNVSVDGLQADSSLYMNRKQPGTCCFARSVAFAFSRNVIGAWPTRF